MHIFHQFIQEKIVHEVVALNMNDAMITVAAVHHLPCDLLEYDEVPLNTVRPS